MVSLNFGSYFLPLVKRLDWRHPSVPEIAPKLPFLHLDLLITQSSAEVSAFFFLDYLPACAIFVGLPELNQVTPVLVVIVIVVVLLVGELTLRDCEAPALLLQRLQKFAVFCLDRHVNLDRGRSLRKPVASRRRPRVPSAAGFGSAT